VRTEHRIVKGEIKKKRRERERERGGKETFGSSIERASSF
jgi:hypothetical protein